MNERDRRDGKLKRRIESEGKTTKGMEDEMKWKMWMELGGRVVENNREWREIVKRHTEEGRE